jgi:hypothetical protein
MTLLGADPDVERFLKRRAKYPKQYRDPLAAIDRR